MLAKLTKNILRGVNFTNLKTSGGYIAKSKPQGVCLQLSQTLGGDFAIWPKYNKGNKYILIESASFTNAPYLRVYLSYKKHKYLFLKEEKKKNIFITHNIQSLTST